MDKEKLAGPEPPPPLYLRIIVKVIGSILGIVILFAIFAAILAVAFLLTIHWK